MSHRVERIDHATLSDDDVVRMNEFENTMQAEAWPEDPPIPVNVTRAGAHAIPDFLVVHEWWVPDGNGRIAAIGYVYWRKTEENKHLASASLRVRPDCRGRGLAKLLLISMLEAVKRDGRTLLSGATVDRVADGEAFARRLGAKLAQKMTENRLVISDVDPALITTWIAEGPQRARGYSLHTFDGPLPDDVIEPAVEAKNIMNTAPRDEMQREDSYYTVEMLREIERSDVAEGKERWMILAREDSTGRFVGLTETFWQASDPTTVDQGHTAVHPDHRGHAIGKWLKATMLERVMRDRPRVVDVFTSNADSNDPMLGINRAMGFKPLAAWYHWDLPVERAEAYLQGR